MKHIGNLALAIVSGVVIAAVAAQALPLLLR
jgi:hypothetical protein